MRHLPIASALLALSACKTAQHAQEPQRPNILFIVSDDHASQAISAYGSGLNRTPNIDRLAEQGALFRSNFVGNSISSPSRASMLTGKHSHANGVLTWERFDSTQTTLPILLQRAGYATGIFGKWHLSSTPMGFDEWMVFEGQGNYYNPDYLTPQGKVRIQGYSAEVTTDLAIDFMERHKGDAKPFLLWCSYKAPHRPWMPGPAYLDLYRNDTVPEPATLLDGHRGRAAVRQQNEMSIHPHMHPGYDLKVPTGGTGWQEVIPELERMTPEQRAGILSLYEQENRALQEAGLQGEALLRWKYQRYMKDYLRCVAAVDDGVGRLLDYLEESGLAEHTIVSYTGDQGFFLGEHGWFDKRWMLEESFRMPFLMRWPGKIAPGTQVDALTQNIDFAPTLLQAAGLPVPADMQGRSFLGLVADGQRGGWREALYYHYHDHMGEHRVPAHYGIRTERYKLIHYYKDGEWELFDLQQDPDELENLYGKPAYRELQAHLLLQLQALRRQYAVPENL